MIRVPEIPEYIKNTPRDVSILFIGAPGIGKSTVIREFAEEEAKELNREFVDFHELSENELKKIFENPSKYYVYVDFRLTEVIPEDLIGIPRPIGDNYYVYVPPLWGKILSLREIYGLLFLDELTNVQRDDVISATYKIVLDRKVGFIKLSPNVRVIACGNDPSHSAIARPLPTPLAMRFEVVKVEPPSLEDWVKWMDKVYDDKWDKRVLAYLHYSRADFSPPISKTEALENFACPRSWTRLAIQIKNITNEKILIAKIYSNLDPSTAGKFRVFIEKYDKIPSWEDVCRNPKAVFMRLDEELRYLLTVFIANKISEECENNVYRFKEFSHIIEALTIKAEYLIVFFLSLSKKLKEQLIKAIYFERKDLLPEAVRKILAEKVAPIITSNYIVK